MGIFVRGNKLWISYKDAAGVWRNASTGHAVGEAAAAKRKLDAVLALVKSQQPAPKLIPSSVRAYAETWLKRREEADLDWRNDRSRLQHHVLPAIGDKPLAEVRAKHIAELVHRWRTTKLETTGEVMAQRTVYNCYSVISAMFRDAEIDGLIENTPCKLTEAQLGPLIDSDPEWRAGAVFTREEAEALISDDRIPLDRRLYYGLELLAGLRPGEIAALRVRSYDSKVGPLGKLTIAHAHNTRKGTTKGTKTNAVRHVPVHPTLASMLAEWLLSGFEAMVGRQHTADDLLLPLPPAAAAARRSRKGEPIRTGDYAGKKWREVDLPMLGWRARQMYDGKSTFITLACEDGANRDVIRDRVTHTKPRRDAFDGYDRGPHWIETCREVAKLRIGRREAIAMAAGDETPQCNLSAVVASIENDRAKSGGGGSRRMARGSKITLVDDALQTFRQDRLRRSPARCT